jgi:hypothetical protein
VVVVMLVLKELKETKEFKVQLDQPEMLVPRGLKVHKVHKLIKDQRVMLL